jgi:SAM-dependent methyltransferase
MTWISAKQNQFTYFAEEIGETDWRGKSVLDFGGNIGNMLRDPNCTIDPERYWCIDIDRESLAAGRKVWPEAHWVHYDRRCFFFNPDGVPNLPVVDVGRKFDAIVAYSVFPNTPLTDMLDLVPQLEQLLEPGGVLAFTFIDQNWFSWPGEYDGDNFRWRLEREKNDLQSPRTLEMIERARRANWCMLVNGTDLYVETEEIDPVPPAQQRTCHVFHTVPFMESLFPHAVMQPPANGEMQHCCLIRKG